MNHEQAFLQAIRDSPADDALRLIFADWLEERGDAASWARAEFIRVQFALLDLPPEHPSRPQLEERERQLLLANESDWLRPLLNQCRLSRWEFRRGFVEKVALSLEQWATQAATIFDLAPIREIEFTYSYSRGDAEFLPAVALSPQMKRLTALDLSKASRAVQDELVALLFSPHLSGLLHLTVDGPLLTNPRFGLLLSVPCLSNLETLSLRSIPNEEWDLEEFFRSDRLSKLRTLDLFEGCWTNQRIGTRLLRQLVAGAGLPSLSTLDFRGNGLNAAAARTLSTSDLLAHLERLYLGRNPLGDPGVSALAESGVCAH